MKPFKEPNSSLFYILCALIITSCNINGDTKNNNEAIDSTNQKTDTMNKPVEPEKEDTLSASATYSNARFREVRVNKIAEHTYTISGEAQIFEANFGWVVEDGHNELKQGFEMTDAGAPEWGNFDFTIEVQKQRENSTLTLILFESSARDGSRQHELPIPLQD